MLLCESLSFVASSLTPIGVTTFSQLSSDRVLSSKLSIAPESVKINRLVRLCR